MDEYVTSEEKEGKTSSKVVGKIKESFNKDPIATVGVGIGCVWATGYLFRSLAQFINAVKWKKYKKDNNNCKKSNN